jgi:lysine N6-hydroxylase
MQTLDLAGIGIGPFNLSLAALLAPLSGVRARFFERRAAFDWHPGMMLPGTRMQTSYLKDLVTPVDPTSPYGFLSYLVQQGRFYRFINADFPRVRRAEFADYLRWVAEQVPNLSFGEGVRAVDCDDRGFVLSLENGRAVRAGHLAVATGMAPHVPSWAERHLGAECLHSHGYMGSTLSVENRRVAIIGGGQSGAEIFLELMAGARGRALDIVWITRRPNLDPLDETAFINEYFTPDYVRHFHGLPEERKSPLVVSQKLTGDGVSPATLQELSQYLYERDFLARGEGTPYRILPHREVYRMEREADGFHLRMNNGFSLGEEAAAADVIILATGYRYAFPKCLAPLEPLISRDEDGLPRLREDYSTRWNGPSAHRVYMLNAGRHSHGIADAQLSLAAWRSAVIVNSLLGSSVYTTEACPPPLRWADSGSDGRPVSHETRRLHGLAQARRECFPPAAGGAAVSGSDVR